MTVLELLHGVETTARNRNVALFEKPVTGVHYDSRQVRPGYLFVAMKGETSDGNLFVADAIASGAVGIVSDSDQVLSDDIAWVRVGHGRRALAGISSNFYSCPAERLKITGVTGTNGKTTTTLLLAQLLRSLGRGEVTLIGTIEYHVGGKVLPAPHTTPESLELNAILAEALSAPATSNEAVMEVSSHALAQERTYGIPYDVAVFTNLTRDHLDYHGSMESYFAAKTKLFDGSGAPPPRVAVINADDEYGRRLLGNKSLASHSLSYGLSAGDYRAEEVKLDFQGIGFRFVTPQGRIEVHSPLLGKVNVYNLVAAATAAIARGAALQDLPSPLAESLPVPGRFQQVDCGQAFTVIVDYAHTDDALRNLTAVAREFLRSQAGEGRVITVFGCGGNRDRSKRPLMGLAAGKGSDFVVLTSDNPRNEDPQAIIEEVLPGLRKTGVGFAVEADRRAAIQLALSEARAGDIVLIAGKGHEKAQITRSGSARFNDVEIARELLQSLGHRVGANQMAGEQH